LHGWRDIVELNAEDQRRVQVAQSAVVTHVQADALVARAGACRSVLGKRPQAETASCGGNACRRVIAADQIGQNSGIQPALRSFVDRT